MQTPILLLTAKGETENRIDGLEAGADEFILQTVLNPRSCYWRINVCESGRRMPDTRRRRCSAQGAVDGRDPLLDIERPASVAGATIWVRIDRNESS